MERSTLKRLRAAAASLALGVAALVMAGPGTDAAYAQSKGLIVVFMPPGTDNYLAQWQVGAKTKAELLPACRALERIIAHSHIFVPEWNNPTHRFVYNAWRLARPPEMPPYAPGEQWAIDTWWRK